MKLAVVVIHGIGEQRPLSTLRGFVSSILNFERKGESPNDDIREWIKPDRISDSYELRKISVQSEEGIRDTTHFYEYHWAHNMRDSKSSHVYTWLKSLMIRDVRGSTRGIRFLQLMSWILLGLWCIPLFLIIYHIAFSAHTLLCNHMIRYFCLLLLPLILTKFSLRKIFIGYLGDAARYLKNDPENIGQRDAIRRNGLEFLKNLHKDGGYGRIKLVGHSLGSVITYDLLTYLWIDFNKSISLSPKQQSKINDRWHAQLAFKVGQMDLIEKIAICARNLNRLINKNSKKVDWRNLKKHPLFLKYRSYQESFWDYLTETSKAPKVDPALQERKSDKDEENHDSEATPLKAIQSSLEETHVSWLISDLITLGSPLTHADLLMADSAEEFNKMKKERQFPTCPPTEDPPQKKTFKERKVTDKDYFVYTNRDGEIFLNHGTSFFPTKWTNIFHKGDPIGGPLNNKFGPGILDIQVEHNPKAGKKWLRDLLPNAHNHYWSSDSTPKDIENAKEFNAIETIYNALDFTRPIKPTSNTDIQA